jgi:hypothetical protein
MSFFKGFDFGKGVFIRLLTIFFLLYGCSKRGITIEVVFIYIKKKKKMLTRIKINHIGYLVLFRSKYFTVFFSITVKSLSLNAYQLHDDGK